MAYTQFAPEPDIAANHGWVSVGIDADTAAFAVESIRRWWQKLGQTRYPGAHSLTITADCGGPMVSGSGCGSENCSASPMRPA